MSTRIRRTVEGTYIVYDTEDDFEYDEFYSYREAKDLVDDLEEISNDSTWADTTGWGIGA